MNTDESKETKTAALAVDAIQPGSKRCPRCGELLFEDMDVCYGCLYDFTREPYRLPEGMIGPATNEKQITEVEARSADPDTIPPEEPDTLDEVNSLPGKGSSAGTVKRLVIKTPELDLSLPLPSRGLTLGRAPDNDVVLHTRKVGEYHLVLVPRRDDVVAVGLADRAFNESEGPATNGCIFLHDGDYFSVDGLRMGVISAAIAAS